jgi:site-specific DNA recombinase
MITLAWSCGSFAGPKGIVHTPSSKPAMKPESRDALLAAISKARAWIEDIRLGRIASFADIAKREGQGERPRVTKRDGRDKPGHDEKLAQIERNPL